MEVLLNGLPYIQITLAVVLIAAVLLQQRGAGLGGALGGGDEGTIHYERRGSERTLFRATMLVAVLFVVASATPLFVTRFVAGPTSNETPSTATTTEAPISVQMVNDKGATTTVAPGDITTKKTDTTPTTPTTETPLIPLGQ